MPLSKPDLVAVVAALAAHAGIAYGLAHVPAAPPITGRSWVRDGGAPPRAATAAQGRAAAAAAAGAQGHPEEDQGGRAAAGGAAAERQAAQEPPKEPPKPVFGVTMSSTTEGDSSIAVPVGNTTMIDPAKSGHGPVVPLPAAPPAAAQAPEYKPVSELYIKKMPEIDADACGRIDPISRRGGAARHRGRRQAARRARRKGARARHQGAERPRARARSGGGLRARRTSCKFTPAIATDGKPAAYVILELHLSFRNPALDDLRFATLALAVVRARACRSPR